GDWLTLIGIYDGDMRSSIAGGNFKWPHIFLPGTAAPEELLVAHLRGTGNSADLLTSELHKTYEQVTVALTPVAGLDPHDFFTEIGRSLNLPTATVRAASVRIWLQNAANMDLAETFIAELKAAIEVD